MVARSSFLASSFLREQRRPGASLHPAALLSRARLSSFRHLQALRRAAALVRLSALRQAEASRLREAWVRPEASPQEELVHPQVSFRELVLLLVKFARMQRHSPPASCREAVGNLICLTFFYDAKTE